MNERWDCKDPVKISQNNNSSRAKKYIQNMRI